MFKIQLTKQTLILLYICVHKDFILHPGKKPRDSNDSTSFFPIALYIYIYIKFEEGIFRKHVHLLL